jgi:hypothetical protein
MSVLFYLYCAIESHICISTIFGNPLIRMVKIVNKML